MRLTPGRIEPLPVARHALRPCEVGLLDTPMDNYKQGEDIHVGIKARCHGAQTRIPCWLGLNIFTPLVLAKKLISLDPIAAGFFS